LEYFDAGHTRVPSSPLLPANDPTLLFATPGMNQFKDTSFGWRSASIRAPRHHRRWSARGGKHTTWTKWERPRGITRFFEMLGNFSFGDYFKRKATSFAWDFLVNELKLDPERFVVYGFWRRR